jgi:hypothetical protein
MVFSKSFFEALDSHHKREWSNLADILSKKSMHTAPNVRWLPALRALELWTPAKYLDETSNLFSFLSSIVVKWFYFRGRKQYDGYGNNRSVLG